MTQAKPPARAGQILDFWFGPLDELGLADPSKGKLWFGFDPRMDAHIEREFTEDVENAARGRLDFWRETPRGRLALIILTDQFPRNIFRGTPRAFAYDHLALAWCLEGLEREEDRHLHACERVFFYLPLEHSELLEQQNRCLSVYESWLAQAPKNLETHIRSYMKYAVDHRDLIVRFGRFPHRNGILGRPSSAEELAHLQKTGKTYGQGS